MSTSHILVVGVNHRSAPVDLRERLAFRQDQFPTAFERLRRDVGLQEAAILSTCNRVEIYAGVSQLDGHVERLHQFLSEHGHVELDGLRPQLYSYVEPQSIRHLFAVASGLDSMVLGESEILQQVKHAYELAREHGTAGKAFNLLFQKALNAGKAVRERTAIGRGGISIGTVAIELSQKIFGALEPYTVLLVGAGKIGELTLKRLTERGVSRVWILNRSVERAQTLGAQYGARADGLDALPRHLLEADIAIFSTASPGALLSRAQVSAMMPQRRHRPLCLVDLGVPRNIDPAIGQLDNVYLFNIDDLQGLVAHHHEQRQQAVVESQVILEHKVNRFLASWNPEAHSCGESSSALAGVP